ncbi:MAG: hypothetical protein GTO14_08675 [Anaerolineales bacterium]|nr:hypothetical protein [Anaerolineales bacterium]
MSPKILSLELDDWRSMREHVDACLPNEACGFLFGSGGKVRVVIPVTNIDHSPFRFRMDPKEQIEAMFRMEAEGYELIAIFHSHPRGPQGPSETDVAEAAYPEAFYLVWAPDGADWGCRAFTLATDGPREIPIHILK